MDVVIVHQHVSAAAEPSEWDVMVQVEHVTRALRQLGHRVRRVACSLDLSALHLCLERRPPDLVFNLVESLAGRDQLAFMVPALLDAIHVPYTGTSARNLFVLADKLLMKELLARHHLPTPVWWPSERLPRHLEAAAYLVKTRYEHASYGMDDRSVLPVDEAPQLADAVAAASRRLGRECFAERYIDGREFNLSLLADDQGVPEVLPPAEIQFVNYPAHKPKIVGYRAKWDEGSMEYCSTPRRFHFPEEDRPLLNELVRLALQCWELFGLRGYARVDFRVDGAGQPWILEVNANPCLAPDAGFAAALQRAGVCYSEAIRRIVVNAQRTSVPR